IKAYIRQADSGVSFEDALKQITEESGMQGRIANAGVSPVEIDWDAAGRMGNSTELDAALMDISQALPAMNNAVDAVDILKTPDKFITSDGVENALRMAAVDTKSSISLDD